MLQSNQLIGFGVSAGFGPPVTVFSDTLNANTGDNANYSFRSSFSVSGGGLQVRATFEASSAASYIADNCAIGIQDTGANTLATPIELLFTGASGFSLTAGQSITSDWLDFVFTVSDVLILITDLGSAGSGRRLVSGASNWYFKAATNSYTDASVAGFTNSGADTVGFNLVEARS